MHEPYEKKLGHPADFRVKYSFRSKEEGGRQQLPYQGIRSDFWYYHESQPNPNSIYMIWPEFEDESGNVIKDDKIAVPKSGTALMWIISYDMRRYHQDKIKVGTKGFFREGEKTTADCEVIEIIGLNTNPTTSKK
jgi:hypothetical protein